MDFADYLLKADNNKMNVDSAKALVADSIRRKIYLKNPVKIYVQYATCEADSAGLYFYEDVYERDPLVLKALTAN